jgi:methylmalonyl-CoA mutase N-terminal domain/subunit
LKTILKSSRYIIEGIMKILAMEIEAAGVKPEQYAPRLKVEAKRVWDLYQSGTPAANLMPLFIECVENDITLGEICNTLRVRWGEYVTDGF